MRCHPYRINFGRIMLLTIATTGLWLFHAGQAQAAERGTYQDSQRTAMHVMADGKHRPQHHEARHAAREHRSRPAVYVKTLPHNKRTVMVNRERYYIHQGRFYRHTPSGYLVVRPPVGAVFAELPFGFLRVTFGGANYLVWNDVFYRHTPRGYLVVNTPAGYRIADQTRVRVTSGLLNVRSGPGLDFEVVGRTPRGAELLIAGSAPGWYYVQLADGGYGWVMSRFTTRTARG